MIKMSLFFAIGYTYSNCQKERMVSKIDCICYKNLTNSYRTVDGTCNNLENPTWGAPSTPLRRIIGKK